MHLVIHLQLNTGPGCQAIRDRGVCVGGGGMRFTKSVMGFTITDLVYKYIYI